MAPRRIHLAAFLIAGNGAHSHALWRHPKTRIGGFLEPVYYVEIVRALERGKFDLAFFADRLAMSDRFGDSLEVGARYGDQDANALRPYAGARAAGRCNSAHRTGRDAVDHVPSSV